MDCNTNFQLISIQLQRNILIRNSIDYTKIWLYLKNVIQKIILFVYIYNKNNIIREKIEIRIEPIIQKDIGKEYCLFVFKKKKIQILKIKKVQNFTILKRKKTDIEIK